MLIINALILVTFLGYISNSLIVELGEYSTLKEILESSTRLDSVNFF